MSTADHASQNDRIRCVVVTPERTLFDLPVESVVLPLFDGELGVMPGRAPVIGRLGYGELRTKDGGTINRYFVDGGFAQVRDNVVTVLTNRATAAGSINAEAATRELETAMRRKATNELDQLDKTKAVDRARALVRVAGHKS